jgi:hypothetical protein
MFLRGFFLFIFGLFGTMDPASFLDLFDAISQSHTNILIYLPSKEEEVYKQKREKP